MTSGLRDYHNRLRKDCAKLVFSITVCTRFIFGPDILFMFLMTVPRLFTIWWLYRSHYMQFILPHILADFPNYSIHNEDGGDLTDLLFNNNAETDLARIVMQAWDFIPSVDRELMVYCWAARQQVGTIRNGLRHPTTSVPEAKALLTKDMEGLQLQLLRNRAVTVVENSDLFVESE